VFVCVTGFSSHEPRLLSLLSRIPGLVEGDVLAVAFHAGVAALGLGVAIGYLVVYPNLAA